MRSLLILMMACLLGGCTLGARPLDFACDPDILNAQPGDAVMHPLLTEIRRDAGGDLQPGGGSGTNLIANALPGDAAAEDISDVERRVRALKASPIYQGLADSMEIKGLESGVRRVLLLSGGGQWGAFGAGFLNAMKDTPELQHIAVVTGVSTGAIQSLFAAVGRYGDLEGHYTSDKALVRPGGLMTVLRKGYLNETKKLRGLLEEALCKDAGNCPLIKQIAQSTRGIYVGMVETETGDFKVINVREIARKGFYGTDSVTMDDAAQCLAGIAMGSSAVPVQLQPVRFLDPETGRFRTFTDGGVRLSVFEAHVASVAQAFSESEKIPVELIVIRNGPTVVKPSETKQGQVMSEVDRKPDASAVGMMSYATLVNQNEIMSIAGLRLNHPKDSIKVATADGYNTHYAWRNEAESELCPRKTDLVFDREFMQCLARWGSQKARNHPTPWIELGGLTP